MIHEPAAQPTSQAEVRTSHIRARACTIIADVLAATEGMPAIRRLLAIGELCPDECTSGPGRAVWLEELERDTGERA